MTVGQRIAQKRKELSLSQESLGGQLGVSRQAIYKWEADAALPEIDKLISLSRIFNVSVGWLLGEEKEVVPAPGEELNENQLHMVEEIVARYIDALPPAPKRRRWPLLLAGLAVLAVFFSLFDRLDSLNSRYQDLQNSVAGVTNNVNNQISSITSRVEQILESQNQLTAERSAQFKSWDLTANTATFTAHAVPKTYHEGMTARLVARSGGQVTEVPAQPGPGNAFQGEITCPLTDEIELSVIFAFDGQEQTQLLSEWNSLYSSSFPYVHFMGGPLWFDYDEKDPDILQPGETQLMTEDGKGEDAQNNGSDIKVGLFRDNKLLFWYEARMKGIILNGEPAQQLFYIRDEKVKLDRNSTYTQAAVLTDEYGRTKIYPGDSLTFEHNQWSHSTVVISHASDLSGWEF